MVRLKDHRKVVARQAGVGQAKELGKSKDSKNGDNNNKTEIQKDYTSGVQWIDEKRFRAGCVVVRGSKHPFHKFILATSIPNSGEPRCSIFPIVPV
jgi:hypothetical protein